MTHDEWIDSTQPEQPDIIEWISAKYGCPILPIYPRRVTRPKLSASDKAEILNLWRYSPMSAHDIAKQFDVSVSTVYRSTKRLESQRGAA